MNAKTQAALKELVACYTHAKTLVLNAEEVDSTLRSNVAIVKEFRDCNDHVMRALLEVVNPSGKDERYILLQIDKAKGHVLRAGYDAIDGIAISSKLKMIEAMKGFSNGAISEVYPKYYEDVIEFDKISSRIASHRAKKDIGDPTHDNLVEYATEANRVAEIATEALRKVPHMVGWDRRNRKQLFFEKVILAAIAGVVIGLMVKVIMPSKSDSSAPLIKQSVTPELGSNQLNEVKH